MPWASRVALEKSWSEHQARGNTIFGCGRGYEDTFDMIAAGKVGIHSRNGAPAKADVVLGIFQTLVRALCGGTSLLISSASFVVE